MHENLSASSFHIIDNKGKLFQEAEIPQIDLQPAGPLPHWMREAKAEDVAIEISTDENSSNDGFSKNTPSVKMVRNCAGCPKSSPV